MNAPATHLTPAPAYAGELVELDQIQAALAELRNRFGVVPDMSTKEGYAAGKAAIKELTGYRTKADKKRLEITAPHRDFIAEVNAYGQQLVADLKELEDPIRAAKKEVDEAEERKKEARVARLRERIQREIHSLLASAAGLNAEELHGLLGAAHALDTQDYYDVTKEAEDAKAYVIDCITQRMHQEAERERMAAEQAALDAERARLRAAEEEIERQKAELAALQAAQAPAPAEEKIERQKAELAAMKAAQAPAPAEDFALEAECDGTFYDALEQGGGAWDEAYGDLLEAGLEPAAALAAMNAITAGKVRHVNYTA